MCFEPTHPDAIDKAHVLCYNYFMGSKICSTLDFYNLVWQAGFICTLAGLHIQMQTLLIVKLKKQKSHDFSLAALHQ